VIEFDCLCDTNDDVCFINNDSLCITIIVSSTIIIIIIIIIILIITIKDQHEYDVKKLRENIAMKADKDRQQRYE
jgi:uncharacterized membrane protein YvbJ